MKEPIHKHFFRFDERGLDSENLFLETSFIPNGDPGVVFTNQKLTLQSYCNSSSIELYSMQITPEILRKLADELEFAKAKAVTLLTLEQEIKRVNEEDRKLDKLDNEKEIQRIGALLETEEGRTKLAQEIVPFMIKSLFHPSRLKTTK